MSDKADAWMPLWIGAYLADTLHLTRDEHGGYLLLLMAYWRARAPLPDDDKRLRTIAKAGAEEWPELRRTLREFFQVADGVWRHKRADQELASAHERRHKAQSKARDAALARWRPDAPSNAPSNAPSIAQALPKQCPTPSPSPIERIKEEKIDARARALTVDQLMADGLIESAAAEFLALRKRKRAPLTARAWDGIKREAVRAGWSIQAAVDKCLTRGWQSFDAAWVSTTSADGMTAKDREHLRVIEGLTGRSRNAANIIDA
jgi:uncharacterized protein YdaU (DUF1376 family)